MTELKTLKDLQYTLMMYGNEVAITQLLKSEAIKWIKEIKFLNKVNGITINDDDKIIDGQELIHCINHFFNLTEEDLK